MASHLCLSSVSFIFAISPLLWGWKHLKSNRKPVWKICLMNFPPLPTQPMAAVSVLASTVGRGCWALTLLMFLWSLSGFCQVHSQNFCPQCFPEAALAHLSCVSFPVLWCFIQCELMEFSFPALPAPGPAVFGAHDGPPWGTVQTTKEGGWAAGFKRFPG